ncbi:hypothetical protein SAMN05421823_1245 [Catalinimonas alkaloidigena]|uniref:Uncharacterized protein n=1 Tax=Catalinimonas alkaloidigena TaxID=1075417 RepID=A0A1G9VUE9_9BACT|nr:hypothetical protein SAMN05421823_1245 [Catalinimonas alkaloidigena]
MECIGFGIGTEVTALVPLRQRQPTDFGCYIPSGDLL